VVRILALDVATRMGVAYGEPGTTPALSVVNFGREFDDQADVFARALRWITNRIFTDAADLVVLEQPVGVHDSSLLLGLRGVMLGALRANNVRAVEVAVATWRVYCLGTAKLKGKDAKARAVDLCARLGWGDNLNHNAAEAAGMWLWAWAQEAPQRVPRHEPLFLRSIR